MSNLRFSISTLSLLCFATVTTHAELTSSVRVRVRNSSNYIYPCNAGIAKNMKVENKGVDFIRASWTASQHNPSAHAGDGVVVAGSTKAENLDPDFLPLSGLLNGGSRPYLSYSQLLPENLMYDYVLGQSLTGSGIVVNMTSDTYDSGFNITFCFKPSMVGNDPNVPLTLKFLHAKATHSVVPGAVASYNYATDSKLMAMVDIKCRKDNGSLVQYYTPTGANTIDSLLTPFSGNTTIDMAPSGGIQMGAGISLIAGSALNPGEIPDDCRVRFYFVETAGTFRPHALTESDIQIDLEASVGSL